MLVYILILVAKIVEVSLQTIRVVLITKGEKKIGAVIGFFEVVIWIYIASTVISGLSDDPLKAVFYALGFALGNYFGSIIENKIGIGINEIQVIVKEEHGKGLADNLRDLGLAVTLVHGEGRNLSRNILIMMVKRKRVNKIVNDIKNFQPNAVISVHDTKPIYGGYGIRK